ncbi:MAG: hypothetical protein ACK5MN_09110 [Lachnospiraceae bacterium]
MPPEKEKFSVKIRNFIKAMNVEIREHKSSFFVYVILRLIVILVMILQLFNRNYENVFLCALTLLLFLIPSFVQVNFKIELPTTLEIIILLFIFAAEILGEISSYYLLFPFWDVLLHCANGFLAAAIGLSLVNILNKSDKILFQSSPFFTVLVAFCFSMTIGAVWELFEFSMDTLFHLDMQKDTIIHTIASVTLDPNRQNIPVTISNIQEVTINGQDLGLGGYLDIGLIDTMYDLFVNFIGAFVFSIFGYFYVKNQGKTGTSGFISRFLPHRK